MASEPKEPRLHVRIVSPTQAFYDGKAVSLSAVNKVGPFDILADHANFFSLLTAGKIIVNNGRNNFEFPITQGIVKATNNNITLFVDIEPAYASEETAKAA
jgi:F0F1-type ATP synthase epsilon subunit